MNTPPPIALLPPGNRLYGPVITRDLLRLVAMYCCIFLTGLYFSSSCSSMALRVFGFGIMLPGGGFLAHADLATLPGWLHFLMALSGILAFIASLALWFATGNVLAPPLTWFLLAVIASRMNHGYPFSAMPFWLAFCVFGSVITANILWRKLRAKKKRVQLNRWLADEASVIVSSLKDTSQKELSPDDVKRMRFLLDRALQPIENFDGFEWLDQFQTAAVRYQLNFLGYALSMAQYHYMPACGAYLHDAQRQLITKLTEHRIWRYWALENAWGNLRYNPNPLLRGNIMFTGFTATQMAMYHAASGRQDFHAPGSFVLKHPSGKCWSSSLPELVHSLQQQMERSPYHLIACEPNWIYPLCNMIGASAIKTLSPETWEKQSERFRHQLDHEFLDWRGKIIPCRSRYTGLALPAIGGDMPQALPCLFLNHLLPDIALRQWLLLRREIMAGNDLKRSAFWCIDTGNYRFSRAAAYASVALAAAEMGDDDVRQACFAALDEECPSNTDTTHSYRPNASVWAHGVEFFARCNAQGHFRHLMTGAPASSIQPHISHAPYPEVLVASAHYTEGKLKATLYNGESGGCFPISISGLEPHAHYTVSGAGQTSAQADRNGKTIIRIQIDGRKSFELYQNV